MSHDIANGFLRGEFTLPPTLAEMVRSGDLDVGESSLAGLAAPARAALDWLPAVQWLLERLRQPLTTSDFETLLSEARAQTRAMAQDETLPPALRIAAYDAHDQARTVRDVRRLEIVVVGLQQQVETLEVEKQTLKRRVDKWAREEAPTDLNHEVSRLLKLIKAGAAACNDFDSYFAPDSRFELVGTWLGAYFNGERHRGQAEPLAVQHNGALFASDTLSRAFKASPENPKPGTRKHQDTSKPEFLELVERWVCAAQSAQGQLGGEKVISMKRAS